jgi:hypothetical protein
MAVVGMPKAQRMPSEWMKETLPMTQEAPQGPAVTSRPTSRDFAPGGESRMMGQAPIPGEVQTVFEQSPGSFLNQIFAGRPGMQGERSVPGDDGNVQTGNQGGEEQAKGSASKHYISGNAVPPIGSQTGPKGAF